MDCTTPLDHGDLVLLFTRLPFDYESDLPLTPAAGVMVARPPYSLLDEPQIDHMPCYLLPGYNLPGWGMMHCCLISKVSETIPNNMTRTDLLFSYLTALRLTAPATIDIASHFQYGGEDDPISQPCLYSLRSGWNPDDNYHYTEQDIMSAGRLLNRITHCLTQGPARLRNAFVLFSQVTNGWTVSYQMSVLGLYSALESLFAPSVQSRGNYAQTLGARVGSFLTPYSNGVNLNHWITQHYEKERHPLSHGFWQIDPRQSPSTNKRNDLGTLHEVLRLSLLGFLSLNSNELAFLNLDPGADPKKQRTALQNGLEALQPAAGDFLTGQRMWSITNSE